MRNELIFLGLTLVVGCVGITNAAEPSRAMHLSFNNIRLGDSVQKIAEKRRTGQCDGKGATLTECTIIDRTGVAYEIIDGQVVRIEATRGIAVGAKLPFGMKIGDAMTSSLIRSLPQQGAQVLVVPTKTGVTLIRMIREPRVDYEFELQLRFDMEGRLESVVYKDVM